MALNFNVYGETVQIWGPSDARDQLGNLIKTWNTDKGTVRGILSTPGMTDSKDITTPAGRIPNAEKILILSPTANIDTGDRLEVENNIYDCMGEHDTWIVRRRNKINHMEIPLRGVIE